MTDSVQLRDLTGFVRRVWWIPVVLAFAGVTLGITTSTSVPPLYRSEATVLVGPTDGSITQTSTIRASEDLAAFYADMARRQVVLQPVVRRLGLPQSWVELRNQVSAVVPDENLRIVTVTVAAKSQRRANDIANQLVDGLVSLSSEDPSENAQAFINEQADNLKAMIAERKDDIDSLEAQARATNNPALKSALHQEANEKKNRLIEWQKVYVELASAEPTADAGGLQVIDEAAPVTDKGRAGTPKQAVLGGGVGVAVGVLISWLMYRRSTATDAPVGSVVRAEPSSSVVTAEQGSSMAKDTEKSATASPRLRRSHPGAAASSSQPRRTETTLARHLSRPARATAVSPRATGGWQGHEHRSSRPPPHTHVTAGSARPWGTATTPVRHRSPPAMATGVSPRATGGWQEQGRQVAATCCPVTRGTSDTMTHTEDSHAVEAPASDPATKVVALDLVEVLCKTLAAEGVVYCHWKSNEAIDRSMTGDNDLDLLVAREHHGRFLEVLASLGFKAAALPPARDVPAVVHYYGLDAPSGRLVHVHAHYRLVLGDDTTKNFCLPIEQAYLASSSVDGLFPVPAPEFELAVLVLRLVLKHSTWDAMLQARGKLAASERRELEWLQTRTDWSTVDAVVSEHLPFVLDVWPECRRAVQPGSSPALRVRAAARLAKTLEPFARRSRHKDTSLRLVRRPTWAARRFLLQRPVRKRLVSGGAVVAIVGGDGSGKSTAVDGLTTWLSRAFVVRRVHLGRPPKSPTTLAVKSALRAGRRVGLWPDLAEPTAPRTDATEAPSTAWLTWHVLTARDRYRLYTRSRRIAANGGIVVCDRYPLEQLRTMDGARTTWARGLPGLTRLGAALIDREARYYAAFSRPDVMAVLRVEPEVAVRRKTDEEENYVRRRSTEVWNAVWDDTTVVVDAAQPAAGVLADLRAAVWERL